MAFDYTTTSLLADIKRKAFVPMAQTTFSDADLLAMADEELQIGVVPLVMGVREEYFVTYNSTLVTASSISFDVPQRAIGSKLRQVTIIVNSDTDVNPAEVALPQIVADQAPLNNNYNQYLNLQAFFLRDNQVMLSPSTQTFIGQTLRLYYFNRPNKLIQTSQCSQITALNGLVATVNLIPASYGSGSLYNITADIVKASPGFKNLEEDVVISVNTTNNQLTFPVDPTTYGVSVGDYICLAGESPVPQIPVELHTLLAQRTAVKVLESLGDEKNFAIAQGKLERMEKSILNLISNRVEGAAKKVINNYSTLNGNPYTRF